MASLRKRNFWYHARIRPWDGIKQGDILISLRTKSKVQALERLAEVKPFEKDIKAGIDFSFPWQNDHCKTTVKHFTVTQAGERFMEARFGDGLHKSTLNRNRVSLNALKRVIGDSFPVERITVDTIESFKTEYQGVHSRQGININLRLIKTFLIWCEMKGYIEKAPKFKLVKIPDVSPSYLTDGEIADLMALGELDLFYKKVFIFHLETGLRLSEPYHGRLDGDWLIINADDTKQKQEQEVELTEQQIKIWRLMMFRYNDWIKKGRKPENFPLKITKIFKKACHQAKVENHKFHDLRHTFAVRMYLLTNDIYKVKQLMGHNSVTTTEKYTKFSRRRLASDFSSLKPYIEEADQRMKMPKIGFRDTKTRDTLV